MGFSRREYWSGLPFPSSGDPPAMGIEPRSPVLQVDSLPSEPPRIYCPAKAVLKPECGVISVLVLSHVQLSAIPWTVACQAPLSMGFPRQEYWSGLPFPSPGDLPDPGIEPRSLTFQADALTSAPLGKPLNTRIQSLRKPPIETQNFRSKY